MDFYLKVKEFLAENAKEKRFHRWNREIKFLKIEQNQIATSGFLETMVLVEFMESIY
nr:hypothetical protein [Bacillus vallismortis]